MGQSLKLFTEEESATVLKAGEASGAEAEKTFLLFFRSARSKEEPVDAALVLLEGYWVAGLIDVVRERLEELAEGA